MDALTGEIRAFAFGYTPENWLPCNGQILSMNDHPELASVLSNLYGGDGLKTFGLPALQGLTLVGSGNLPGGFDYYPGETGGASEMDLSLSEIPAHTHTVNTLCMTDPEQAPAQEVTVPTGMSYLSNVYEVPPPTTKRMGNFYTPNAGNPVILNDSALTPQGRGYAHNNMQPYLPINYCICTDGDYPNRS